MLRQYRLRDYRFRLVCYVFAITIIGILVIGSAEKSVQDQQIFGMVLGTVAMVVISLIDYNWVLKFYWLIYAFNLLLLLLVETPLGDGANGAVRWLNLGGFRFQPSELCKLCLILFFAKFFEKYKDILNTWKILGLSALLFGLPAFLVVNQPDLSTTISLCVIFVTVIFAAGLSWKLIGGALAVGIPAVVVFISLIMQPDQTIVEDYQRRERTYEQAVTSYQKRISDMMKDTRLADLESALNEEKRRNAELLNEAARLEAQNADLLSALVVAGVPIPESARTEENAALESRNMEIKNQALEDLKKRAERARIIYSAGNGE